MNKRYLLGLMSILLVFSTVILSGCAEEGSEVLENENNGVVYAKDGDMVSVHYTGTLDDGTVFDSSKGRDPLSFTVGDGSMIQGFDRAVNGMALGDIKTVTIPSEEAYGPYREELINIVNRSELPEGLEPEVGQKLMGQKDGYLIEVKIIEVNESSVTMDANSELAGKDLTFEIELVDIVM
ncbi:MAG: peptidylprolyl isomerase [Halobacteriota archaeon]|nr:peptidylprolyl isomerase [Halobacteriota archaeon]